MSKEANDEIKNNLYKDNLINLILYLDWYKDYITRLIEIII